MSGRLRLVLIATALSLVGLGARDGSASSPLAPLTFVDDRNGQSLTVQSDRSAPDAGHLVFRVPTHGTYVVEVATAMTTHSATSTTIDYQGPALLRPATDASGAVTGTVTAPSTVAISLHAQLDVSHHSASATLDDHGSIFKVVSAPLRGDVSATISAVEKAVLSQDPRELYPFMSGDVTSRYTVSAFADAMNTQAAATNRVTALRRLSVSAPATSPQGLTYVIASYSVDFVAPGGAPGTKLFDIFFIDDAGTWRIAFTRAH